jgi:hypothetical protein
MDTPASRSPLPARAIASALFACASISLWIIYGHLHWRVLRNHYRDIPDSVRPELFGLLSQLDIIYRMLALTAVIWCVWSWRTERRVFAVIASLFAAVALLAALSMM